MGVLKNQSSYLAMKGSQNLKISWLFAHISNGWSVQNFEKYHNCHSHGEFCLDNCYSNRVIWEASIFVKYDSIFIYFRVELDWYYYCVFGRFSILMVSSNYASGYDNRFSNRGRFDWLWIFLILEGLISYKASLSILISLAIAFFFPISIESI